MGALFNHCCLQQQPRPLVCALAKLLANILLELERFHHAYTREALLERREERGILLSHSVNVAPEILGRSPEYPCKGRKDQESDECQPPVQIERVTQQEEKSHRLADQRIDR